MHKTSNQPCPWWLIPTFDNPLRRFVHDPKKILAGWVEPNMTALDVGCGMGYFTLPLARLVQPEGTVIAADLQPEMLNGLRRRAARAGLLDSICFLNCTPDRIGLDKSLDFALAFWMVHEVRHPEPFMQEIFTALKPGGRLLVVEPVVHVPREAFELTISLAKQLGFTFEGRPEVRLSRAALFRKQ